MRERLNVPQQKPEAVRRRDDTTREEKLGQGKEAKEEEEEEERHRQRREEVNMKRWRVREGRRADEGEMERWCKRGVVDFTSLIAPPSSQQDELDVTDAETLRLYEPP